MMTSMETTSDCVQSELDKLDRVLDQLGMLSTTTPARKSYLIEKDLKRGCVIPNVSGYCIRIPVMKSRYTPYCTTRHRTRSENSDSAAESGGNSFEYGEPSGLLINSSKFSNNPLKKCQSLESLCSDVAVQTEPDLDCVSVQIQQLSVDK